MTYDPEHRVCDYEGSAYRTEFWGQGRAYEDGAERVALERMLPSTGGRLIDVGGGYGRLVPLYSGYEEVIIFDYALSQLRQAQNLWGRQGPNGKPRYIYVAGDFYRFPFTPASFDTVVMVRTLHHAVDAPAVVHGVSEILRPHGALVLEFANKRNMKAIFRYLAGRQAWSPFDQEPVEFVPLNFDFHPAWVTALLSKAQLQVQERRAVSTFRLNMLKRLLPTDLLVSLDRFCQPMGGWLPLSPSVFVLCEAQGPKSRPLEARLFRCTACGSIELEETIDRLTCSACSASFPIQDGIYNFKTSHADALETSTAGSRSEESDGAEALHEP